MKSKAFELNKDDFNSILRDILVIYSPVFILFFEQIKEWNFDEKILAALFLSTTIDIVRKFIKNNLENENSDNRVN